MSVRKWCVGRFCEGAEGVRWGRRGTRGTVQRQNARISGWGGASCAAVAQGVTKDSAESVGKVLPEPERRLRPRTRGGANGPLRCSPVLARSTVCPAREDCG